MFLSLLDFINLVFDVFVPRICDETTFPSALGPNSARPLAIPHNLFRRRSSTIISFLVLCPNFYLGMDLAHLMCFLWCARTAPIAISSSPDTGIIQTFLKDLYAIGLAAQFNTPTINTRFSSLLRTLFKGHVLVSFRKLSVCKLQQCQIYLFDYEDLLSSLNNLYVDYVLPNKDFLFRSKKSDNISL